MRERPRSLLDLIRVHEGVTIDELASEMNLTRTTIINHLRLLMGEGLVKRAGLRRGLRRPSVVYELTANADRMFPQQYEDFSKDVLQELAARQPARAKAILAAVGKRWIDRDASSVKGLRGTRRTQAALALLSQRGFMPRLEGPTSNRVLAQYNCPLRSLCQTHLEVPELIRRWMQSLLGVGLTRIRCAATGDRSCAYALRRLA